MAALRLDTYELAAWPRFLGRAFQNNGVWTALLTALSIAVFLLGAAAFIDPAALFGRHGGNFYALLSHNFMVSVFGAVALFVLAAIVIGMARRSEEHTSELQSLMRISYAVFCLKKKKSKKRINTRIIIKQ